MDSLGGTREAPGRQERTKWTACEAPGRQEKTNWTACEAPGKQTNWTAWEAPGGHQAGNYHLDSLGGTKEAPGRQEGTIWQPGRHQGCTREAGKE